jgi:acetyltransferase-like isoleucine patch superfamily enzyme
VSLITWYLKLRYPRVTFGPGFKGPLRLRIRGRGRVRFGRDVRISNRQGKTALLTFSPQARIEVGDRVEIDGAGIMSASEIFLEADSVLGPCLIVDTDFHSISRQRRSAEALPDRRPIRIQSGAWIQGKATVLKGVTVGEGAVVRWGSVVASDVPPGAIVAGNPATVAGGPGYIPPLETAPSMLQ